MLTALEMSHGFCVASDDVDRKLQVASSCLLSAGLMTIIQSLIGIRYSTFQCQFRRISSYFNAFALDFPSCTVQTRIYSNSFWPPTPKRVPSSTDRMRKFQKWENLRLTSELVMCETLMNLCPLMNTMFEVCVEISTDAESPAGCVWRANTAWSCRTSGLDDEVCGTPCCRHCHHLNCNQLTKAHYGRVTTLQTYSHHSSYSAFNYSCSVWFF